MMVWSTEALVVGNDDKVTDSGEPPRKGMDDCPRLEPSPFDSFCQEAHRDMAVLLRYLLDLGVASIDDFVNDSGEVRR
jgi:hypothetical protein